MLEFKIMVVKLDFLYCFNKLFFFVVGLVIYKIKCLVYYLIYISMYFSEVCFYLIDFKYWFKNLCIIDFLYKRSFYWRFLNYFFFFVIVIYSFKLSRNYVDWYSVDEVYFYSDVIIFKIVRIVI